MKDQYPSEKFLVATGALATSPLPLQERIANAFACGLYLLLVHSSGLSEDTKRKLQEYEAAWKAVDDAAGEGTIKVWASRLSDDEATEIATWIVDTAFELERQLWSND